MDAIDDTFGSGIINRRLLSRPIRHALSLGKKTLNRYYGLTDDSDIYRLSMGKSTLPLFLSFITYALKCSTLPSSLPILNAWNGLTNGLPTPLPLPVNIGAVTNRRE